MLRQSSIWLMRLVLSGLLLAVLALTGIAIVGRFWLGSHLDQFRPRIEAALSHQAAVDAHIGHLAVEWHGLLPEFILRDVRLQDAAGHVDLSLEGISAQLAFWPLLTGRVDFARLQIDHPVLRVLRRLDGRVLVAGILLPTPTEEPGSPFVDWLLNQREVRINDGRLEWEDQLASGGILTLPHLQLRLQGQGSRHQFDLAAEAPAALMRGLHISGTLAAGDSRHLEAWQGVVNARLAFLDISELTRYARLPVDWRSGRGGFDLTVHFAHAQVQSLATDARIQNVGLTVAPDLPELRFEHLSGHVDYERSATGFRLAARQLLAQAPPGAGVPAVRPADFDLAFDAKGGTARADVVNLGALAALTESLPLPRELRVALRERAPLGVVEGLQADWKGAPDALGDFKVRARLLDVSLQSVDEQPGVRHLTGTIEADQAAGTVAVDAQEPVLLLPRAFPQPLQLHAVQASAHWVRRGKSTTLTLDRVRIDDPDIAGALSGTLEFSGGNPGRAQLVGLFDHVELPAVPRFLPSSMHADVRAWLARALRAGHAHQVQLNLAGDLRDFPFGAKGNGVFHVHVPVDGVTLDYGPGWPAISGLRGVLDFDGPGLSVHAVEAHVDRLAGRDLLATIADLDARDPILLVHGTVSAPLQAALDFMLQSPLKRNLGEFASTFLASGDGITDLSLRVPVNHADDTTVKGELVIQDATLRAVDKPIPTLSALRGRLQFSDQGVEAQGLAAQALGGPVEATLQTASNGDILLTAHGQFDAAEADHFYTNDRLDFLRGAGDWKGSFRFGSSNAQFEITGHAPVYAAPASFVVRQGADGPLTVEASGSPACATVVGSYVPFLAGAAEGTLAWQVHLSHDTGADQLSGGGHCQMFGRPSEFVLSGHPDAVVVDISGGLDSATLGRVVPGPLAGVATGTTAWEVHIDERPGRPLVQVSSDLRGAGIDLPPPFGKPAADARPLHLSLARLRGTSDLYLSGGIDQMLGIASLVPAESGQSMRRFAVRVGGAAVLPSADGLTVTGTLARVDLAAWRSALEAAGRRIEERQPAHPAAPAQVSTVASEEPATIGGMPVFMDLQIAKMISGRHEFEAHQWRLRTQGADWHVQVQGPQLAGEADWNPHAAGKLTAHFDRVWLPSGAEAAAGDAKPFSSANEQRPLPVIALDVLDFKLDGRALGRLELQGEPEAEGWHIARLALTQPQGTLTAEGHWTVTAGRSRTRLDARLDAPDTGGLLVALGYGKALSRGRTRLDAKLEWPGDPEDFAPARLAGTLDLDSRSGQFLTLEPGVGRLLGLLSLQALPRRVTLDFRDIFSQGFAFDAITGHFDIKAGAMTTHDLRMVGPAAAVNLDGRADLVAETQDLTVKVLPAVGDGVSIASTVLLGPVVGASTWLVNKLLGNPIDRILTYSYRVTGSWDDPQVVPLDGKSPPAAPVSSADERRKP